MGRKVDTSRLDRIRDAIIEYPEQKAGGYARLLGYDNKTVVRALPQLEERGDLLVEDDNGRLTWIDRVR